MVSNYVIQLNYPKWSLLCDGHKKRANTVGILGAPYMIYMKMTSQEEFELIKENVFNWGECFDLDVRLAKGFEFPTSMPNTLLYFVYL